MPQARQALRVPQALPVRLERQALPEPQVPRAQALPVPRVPRVPPVLRALPVRQALPEPVPWAVLEARAQLAPRVPLAQRAPRVPPERLARLRRLAQRAAHQAP